MDILNPFNDLAKDIFSKQPIIIVLFLIFIFLLLIFYATRTVSKQQSEDHKEKGLLIELIRDSNTMFGKLSNVIEALKIAQEKRNESIIEQIKEQKTTNHNLSNLNTAFADYHTSIADTITILFKNQITGRLDKMDEKIEKVYDLTKNKSDCNNEILDKLTGINRDIETVKDYLVKKETERLENLE